MWFLLRAQSVSFQTSHGLLAGRVQPAVTPGERRRVRPPDDGREKGRRGRGGVSPTDGESGRVCGVGKENARGGSVGLGLVSRSPSSAHRWLDLAGKREDQPSRRRALGLSVFQGLVRVLDVERRAAPQVLLGGQVLPGPRAPQPSIPRPGRQMTSCQPERRGQFFHFKSLERQLWLLQTGWSLNVSPVTTSPRGRHSGMHLILARRLLNDPGSCCSSRVCEI